MGERRPPPWRSTEGRWCLTAEREPKETGKRRKVVVPTPEEWAEQQLKNAPPRTEEWARQVARIWCLDIGESAEDDTGNN